LYLCGRLGDKGTKRYQSERKKGDENRDLELKKRLEKKSQKKMQKDLVE
jgi:hypothetical protein